jgi:F-type H+-transporting ATPase subunit delta
VRIEIVANEVAAKRYARAAFELAVESGDVAAWSSALGSIAHLLSDGETARALQNARVSKEVKHRVIDAGLADVPQMPRNLAHVLVSKGRTGLAVEIAEQFSRLAEEHEGIARAHALTAVELSDVDRDALRSRLAESTGRNVILETDVDPSILGGVVLQIGDKLIDGSTKARLEALKDSLVGAVR